ncbi:MAG: transglutaminase domain-containing protein [Candidatus Lokiarchaeota archaeon]|nr:transglutaminase domain-containing protein [Candidatus Lokiarchaeota archaeon]
MKVKKTFFIVFLFIFPWISSAILTISAPTEFFNHPSSILSTSSGVSNFNISGSVTYQVEIDFTLTVTSGTGSYWFKFSRLNDRQPNSLLTQYCPPYQESELLYSNIVGSDSTPYLMQDKFNNTYDLFNSTLNQGQSVSLSQRYNVTLNAVSFKNVNYSDIGPYDVYDEMFDLYCNNSETYYERDNAALISESNSIVNPTDNPIEKAEKICNWVSSNLIYDGTLPAEEMGALWAHTNGRGDCSEFSSLMVTLLRIQDIPARKVTGYCISANPTTKPYEGQVWNFIASSSSGSNFLGHAWVEYYVPDIGWIACDPTWHSGGFDYFNRIDYLRFNLNIGQWFSIPMLSDVSEFPNPCIVYNNPSFDFVYQFKVTATESSLSPSDQFPMLIVIVVMAAIVIALVAIILPMTIKRKRKKEVTYYEY